jgi:hypothetical protein
MRVSEIVTPGVDFAEMDDQYGFVFTTATNQDLEILQKSTIGKILRLRHFENPIGTTGWVHRSA